MQATLVMFKSDGNRRDFPLEGERTIIGRKSTSDLRIPLASVSRQHCELVQSDGQLLVRDLGSSNGTYHNSTRVQEATLRAGDELVVGPVVFVVVIDGEPGEIEPVRTVVDPTESIEDEPVHAPLHATPLPDQHHEMPRDVEPESSTPTIDLDDPLTLLEPLEDD